MIVQQIRFTNFLVHGPLSVGQMHRLLERVDMCCREYDTLSLHPQSGIINFIIHSGGGVICEDFIHLVQTLLNTSYTTIAHIEYACGPPSLLALACKKREFSTTGSLEISYGDISMSSKEIVDPENISPSTTQLCRNYIALVNRVLGKERISLPDDVRQWLERNHKVKLSGHECADFGLGTSFNT